VSNETKNDAPAEEIVVDLYTKMARIRMMETAISDAYAEQEMKCPIHLSIGQEAVAAGVCQALRETDEAVSTHRGHAHYIAKGGNLNRMMAELYGKATGCAGGKGGSMHLVDPSVGFRGCSAIVGGTIPIAVGIALAAKMKGTDKVAVPFFGDGAADEGVLYEAMNFAAIKKLPVIFTCENNLYATCSPQSARQLGNLTSRAEAFGIPAETVDGIRAIEVFQASTRAVERARAGQGPSFIEFKTYRWRKHVGPEYDIDLGYRTQEELDEWMSKCPVETHKAEAIASNILTEEAVDSIRAGIADAIESAFAFAKDSAPPQPESLLTNVDSGGETSILAKLLPVLENEPDQQIQEVDVTAALHRTGF
jgi:pyruvate dehydrogenase E1 component alpha subunit